MSSPNRPEPAPKPGQIDVWPEFFLFFQQTTAGGAFSEHVKEYGADAVQSFIDDCYERNQIGIAKYGTPLQTGNGRDCDRDLYQELLDAIAYCFQGVLECDPQRPTDGFPARALMLRQLVSLAIAVRAGLQ